jgi:flagellar hook-length control protein FliK
MQTTTLPIQAFSAAPAPQRDNGAAAASGTQFSQALSREVQQRQNAPDPTPAPASQAPAKQQQASAPAQPDKPAAAKPAKADDTEKKTARTDADSDADAKDAADAAAVTPVASLIALVAHFNQPAAKPGADAAETPVDAAAAGAGKHAKVDIDPAALKGHAARGPAPAADGAEPEQRATFAVEAAATDAKPGRDALALRAAADAAPANGAELRAKAADVARVAAPDAPAPLPTLVAAAATAASQVAAATPTDRIAARVGTPGWDNQVGQKIVWMVAGKEQSASLTLNPPDMGPMQVVLSVTNDQASVTFSAHQPEVRQALEDAMPKLREMLGQSGISLGNATVDAGSSSQQQAQQGGQSRGGRTGFQFGADAGPEVQAGTTTIRTGGGNGLVDTFA